MVEASCRHHWKIENPNGLTSLGTCKVCYEKRPFYNVLPEEPGGMMTAADLRSEIGIVAGKLSMNSNDISNRYD